MASPLARWLASSALVALCLTGGTSWAQGFKWWKDDAVQKRLNLGADQSRKIDELFRAAMPALRNGRHHLEAAERDLQDLIEDSADDAPVIRQLERVEAARGELNKSRTLMLLRMRRVLSPEQRVELDALYREWSRGGRRPHRSSPNTP